MNDSCTFIDTLPPLNWEGGVQIQTSHRAVEIGGDVRVRLTWSQPVQPADFAISLRDRKDRVIWPSLGILAGTPELEFKLPQNVGAGNYRLNLRLDDWLVAEERIEVLEPNQLASYEAFAEAVSFRQAASRAEGWEETARLDELAAEAYERSGAGHLAAVSFLDVVEVALANNAADRVRDAAVRATALAARSENMAVLADALLRLGQVDAQSDRKEIAISTLDRASTIAELANIDLLSVKSSMLQWRCSLFLDRTRQRQHYQILMPKLAYAVSPAAQKEAISYIKELKFHRALEYVMPGRAGPREWKGSCNFDSRYLSQFADASRMTEVMLSWDYSAETFSNALIKRIVTSLAKSLMGFSLNVPLVLDANRAESGESFKVALGDRKSQRKVVEATHAWSQGSDFAFLNELSVSVGGIIQANPEPLNALVELSLPHTL
jgi:hypothetical protein